MEVDIVLVSKIANICYIEFPPLHFCKLLLVPWRFSCEIYDQQKNCDHVVDDNGHVVHYGHHRAPYEYRSAQQCGKHQ